MGHRAASGYLEASQLAVRTVALMLSQVLRCQPECVKTLTDVSTRMLLSSLMEDQR